MVEAAYPGLRLYYVLTYTRGIQPPFPNSVSIVAAVNDSGRVVPYRPGAPESYRYGLVRVNSSRSARHAAAAVLILSTADPNGRRSHFDPKRFRVRRDHGDWLCSFAYEPYYESWVRFDRNGRLVNFGGSGPPVP